jgi:hypothetical protein
MKLFLVTAILLVNYQVFAQKNMTVTPAPSPSVDDNATSEDTIVKPTNEQLKTVPKKKKVVKESEINKTDDTIMDEKKVEAPVVETASKAPQLFGFHADLNFPHILNYGVDYWSSSRRFSAAISLGGYSQNGFGKTATDTGADLKISNQEIALRYHPFQSAFYVGGIYGQHALTGSKTATYTVGAQSRTTTITDKITAQYFTPHFGWLWKADYGLTFGMDFGYLFPINSKSTIDEGDIVNDPLYPALTTQQDYIDNKRKIQADSNQYGNSSVPFVALLRFGWLF